MVTLFQRQPDDSLRGPIDWYQFLGWEGEPVTSDPIYRPVQFADSGTPYHPQSPLAPSLSAIMGSRTTVDLVWVPASGFTGPAIVSWEVEMRTSTDNGVSYGAWAPILGSPFDDDVFTANLTGMAVQTAPELRFQFQARGENGDGLGDWSTPFEVQWNSVVVNPPRPPRTLTITNVTATSARLSWIASVGADTDGATKQGIFSVDTDLNVDIDPNAVTFVWANLPQGTAFNGINVRRFNAGGWSGGTNRIDFQTLRNRLTTDDPVMGQSLPNDQNARRTQCPAVRVYNSGDVVNFFNDFDPRVIAYTDDPFSNGGGGGTMAYVDHVQTMLDNFYNGTPAREACEIHVAYGNEVDRNYASGTLPQSYINVYQALRQLIWGTTGGQRDYPMASVWVDMTANNINTNQSGPRFRPIAQYLDGMACSMYPAGRTIQSSNPLIEYDPASYPAGSQWSGLSRNAYHFYIDPVFAALADWRDNGGPGGTAIHSQLNQFATWEIGIPIHHSLASGNINNLVRTGADATDLTQRPRYLVGGARVTGPADQQYNMVGFLPYIQQKCDAEDVSMREQLYWNQWSNTPTDDSPGTSIPNPWDADYNKTPIDSVTAWYQYHVGFRLADI